MRPFVNTAVVARLGVAKMKDEWMSRELCGPHSYKMAANERLSDPELVGEAIVKPSFCLGGVRAIDVESVQCFAQCMFSAGGQHIRYRYQKMQELTEVYLARAYQKPRLVHICLIRARIGLVVVLNSKSRALAN